MSLSEEYLNIGLDLQRIPHEFGQNYDAWRIPILSPDQFVSLSDVAKLQYIVHFSTLASSSHNTQPWSFDIDSTAHLIKVHADVSRILPDSDKRGRQACVSIGCAVGTLIASAADLGYTAIIENIHVDPSAVVPDSHATIDGKVPLALVYLKPHTDNNLKSSKNREAIVNRRVERRQHDKSLDFSEKYYHLLNSLVEGTPGLGCRLFRRNDPLKRIGRVATMQAFADRFVADDPTFATELSQWLIENDSKSYVGMPGSTFNLPPNLTRTVIMGLKDKSKKDPDNIAGFAKVGLDGINSAAVVGMLTVKEDMPASWQKVGQVLSAIQLLTEQNGGGLAIHAGLAEVKLPTMMLQALGLTTEKPVILFRAGIREGGVEARLPHSPRLPLEKVLK